MAIGCTHPLIIHRVPTATRPGEIEHAVEIRECPDPRCLARQEDHEQGLPCRWAWRYAHGKTSNGEQFPKMHCPGCLHIQRRGDPFEQIEEAG